MKMIACRCPNCGANLQIEEGKEKVFCTYCGTPILIDNENRTVTYRTVDEARIREAEMQENIFKKQSDLARLRTIIIGILAGIILIAIIASFIFATDEAVTILIVIILFGFNIGMVYFGMKYR